LRAIARDSRQRVFGSTRFWFLNDALNRVNGVGFGWRFVRVMQNFLGFLGFFKLVCWCQGGFEVFERKKQLETKKQSSRIESSRKRIRPIRKESSSRKESIEFSSVFVGRLFERSVGRLFERVVENSNGSDGIKNSGSKFENSGGKFVALMFLFAFSLLFASEIVSTSGFTTSTTFTSIQNQDKAATDRETVETLNRENFSFHKFSPIPWPIIKYDYLALSTGEKSFPTDGSDTQTVNLSYARVSSSLPNAFEVGENTIVNVVFYITDSVPAGQGSQGDIFYQDPSTGYFKKYYSPDSQGVLNWNSSSGFFVMTNLTNVFMQYLTPNASCGNGSNEIEVSTFYGTLNGFLTLNANVTSMNKYSVSFTNAFHETLPTFIQHETGCPVRLLFNNASGTINPRPIQYSITFNRIPYDYGPKKVHLEFFANGITAFGDPDSSNGYVIAIPEYLNETNSSNYTSMGAFLYDVGGGSTFQPQFGSLNKTALLAYNYDYEDRNVSRVYGIPRRSGFVSPRGSTGNVSVWAGSVNYLISLLKPMRAEVAELEDTVSTVPTGIIVPVSALTSKKQSLNQKRK